MTPAPADTIAPVPLITRDFADPDMLRTADGWLAFSTNSVYGDRLWHVPTQRAESLRGPGRKSGTRCRRCPAGSTR